MLAMFLITNHVLHSCLCSQVISTETIVQWSIRYHYSSLSMELWLYSRVFWMSQPLHMITWQEKRRKRVIWGWLISIATHVWWISIFSIYFFPIQPPVIRIWLLCNLSGEDAEPGGCYKKLTKLRATIVSLLGTFSFCWFIAGTYTSDIISHSLCPGVCLVLN